MRRSLLSILAQKLAGLSVEKVKSGAGRTDYAFIVVFAHIIVLIQPVLDQHRCIQAGKNESGHRSLYRPSWLDFDIAQRSGTTATMNIAARGRQ
jgi:hypothetical protein